MLGVDPVLGAYMLQRLGDGRWSGKCGRQRGRTARRGPQKPPANEQDTGSHGFPLLER